MALSADDKLLGEKVHNYCSSSEDEGEDDHDEGESGAGAQAQQATFIPEPQIEDYKGYSVNVSKICTK